MYKFTYKSDKDEVTISRDLREFESVDYVVEMFVQFLIANEFRIDSINKYIRLEELEYDPGINSGEREVEDNSNNSTV